MEDTKSCVLNTENINENPLAIRSSDVTTFALDGKPGGVRAELSACTVYV